MKKTSIDSHVLPHLLLSLILAVMCTFALAVPARAAAANTSFSSASAITLGDTINVSVAITNEDSYYYSFTMAKGGVVSVNTTCNVPGEDDRTLEIQIYNAKQQQCWSTGDKSDTFSLTKGSYVMKVSGWNIFETGNFTIATSVAYAGSATDNQAASTAKTHTLGGTFTGNIGKDSSSYAESWYSFTMKQGGVVNWSISSDTIDSLHVEILNSAKQTAYSEYNTAGTVSLAKGTYYLKITHYDGDGNFKFTTKVSYAADSADNRDAASAEEFTLGEDLSCNIGKSGSSYAESWYKFTMTKGGVVDWSIVSDTVEKLHVEVLNSAQKTAYSMYDTKDTVSLAKGTYYLKITHYDGDGNFTLKTVKTAAGSAKDNHDFSTAVSITVGNTYHCNVGKNGSSYADSYYKFTMSKGGVFTWKAKSNTVENLHVLIYNASEKETCSEYDLEGSASLAKGTYYLRICQYDGDGNFTLTTGAELAGSAVDNHDYSSAREVTVGNRFTGNTGKSGSSYLDSYYKFTMAYGGVFTWKATSDTVEKLHVIIYNASKKETYSAYDLSDSVSLAKGTYYLRICQYDGEGNYSFRTSADYAKNAGFNTSFAKAELFTLGKNLSCNIGRNGSVYRTAYYKFKMDNKGVMKYTVDIDEEGVDQVYITIYDSSKTEKVLNTTLDAKGTLTLAKGTYYIRLERYSGEGNYTLKNSVVYENPMTAKLSSSSVTRSTTKDQTRTITVSNSKGKITYTSTSKYVTVSSKGVVTVKKSAPKGTVYITVKDAGTTGTNRYKSKSVKLKLVIK